MRQPISKAQETCRRKRRAKGRSMTTSPTARKTDAALTGRTLSPCPSVGRLSNRIPLPPAAAHEIEITPPVRLQDVTQNQPAVAAAVVRLRRRSLPEAPGNLAGFHKQIEPAPRNVQLDQVALPHRRQRAADRGLGRHVDHN